MTGLNPAAEREQQEFITKIVAAGKVWGLYCEEGWSNADSCELEDTLVYPFWSEAELAASCAVDEWDIYQPRELELNEFLENWCIGMYKEYILAGINWDSDLEGSEVEPVDLALRIIQEVKKQNKDLQFRFYKDLKDFEQMLHEVIEEERKSIN